jgi:hypothetical protein
VPRVANVAGLRMSPSRVSVATVPAGRPGTLRRAQSSTRTSRRQVVAPAHNGTACPDRVGHPDPARTSRVRTGCCTSRAAARRAPAHVDPTGTVSGSAAQHLSPAYPRRAPWGTAERSVRGSRRPVTPTWGAGRATSSRWPRRERQDRLRPACRHLAGPLVWRAPRPEQPGLLGRGRHVRRGGVALPAVPHPCENRKTLVFVDETHHAGDSLSRGDAVQEAFDPPMRLALTGTLFRSDTDASPSSPSARPRRCPGVAGRPHMRVRRRTPRRRGPAVDLLGQLRGDALAHAGG